MTKTYPVEEAWQTGKKSLEKVRTAHLTSTRRQVKGMVDVMIATHDDLEKCRRAHLSWDLIEAKTLEKLEEMQVKIKHPGFKHYGETGIQRRHFLSLMKRKKD